MPVSFEILFSIEDGKGNLSTTSVNIPNTFTIAQIITFGGEMAKLIDPLITGRIVRIGAAFLIDLPNTLATTADANADVEEGARFQFRTAGGYYTSMRLATFDEAFILPNSDLVDQTEAAVAAFITAIHSGLDIDATAGVTLVAATDSRGDDIVALEFAREQFLSSRKRAQ